MAATEMPTYPRETRIGGIFLFFAADGQPLRLAGSPLPLYRAGAAIQGKTLPVAVCGLGRWRWQIRYEVCAAVET